MDTGDPVKAEAAMPEQEDTQNPKPYDDLMTQAAQETQPKATRRSRLSRLARQLWTRKLEGLSTWRRWTIVLGRVFLASLISQKKHRSSLLAAGLTFVTLMALIPLLSVFIAIADAFGVKESLTEWLQTFINGSNRNVREFMGGVMELVNKVDIKTIGALALLFLIYTIMNLMSRVEEAFNLTWKASKGRNLARRYADYAAILFLAPLMVLISAALTTALALEDIHKQDDRWHWLATLLESGLTYLPLLLLCLAATFVYKVMPNAKVRWLPSAIAGVLAGVLLWSTQLVISRFQIGLTQANAIYGGLAFMPLFLLYLHFSWTIVLFGCEICYSIQNFKNLTAPREKVEWSAAHKRAVGLAMMRAVLERFAIGKTLSLAEFASISGRRRDHVDELCQLLRKAGLVHQVRFGEGVLPGRPADQIGPADVILAIDGSEGSPAAANLNPAELRALEHVREAMKNS